MERYVKERLVGAAVLVAAGIILIPEMLSGPKDWTERTAANSSEADGTLKSYSIDLTKRNEVPQRMDEGAHSATGPAAAPTTAPTPGQADSSRRATPSTQTAATAGVAVGSAAGQGNAVGDDRVQTGAAPPSEEADASPNALQPNVAAARATHSAPQERAPGAGASGVNSAGKPSGKVASREAADGAGKEVEAGSAAKPARASGGSGWAVQIGSYATASRAQQEVAEIKTKGFDAFVMPFKLQNKTLYRVRVGPQNERGSAEAVAARLHAKGLTGAVVKHP